METVVAAPPPQNGDSVDGEKENEKIVNSNWGVRLSLHEYPKKNSDVIMSIDCDDSNPLSLSEAIRDVIEHTPDFMVKLCRREQKQVIFKQRAFPLLLKYGCGFMTLILLDGAELPDDLDDVPVVIIRAIVDDLSTKDSLERSNKRIEEHGTILGEGTLRALFNFHERDYRNKGLFIHKLEEYLPIEEEGTWHENMDRKHVWLCQTDPKNLYEAVEVKRSLTYEQIIATREAAMPSPETITMVAPSTSKTTARKKSTNTQLESDNDEKKSTSTAKTTTKQDNNAETKVTATPKGNISKTTKAETAEASPQEDDETHAVVSPVKSFGKTRTRAAASETKQGEGDKSPSVAQKDAKKSVASSTKKKYNHGENEAASVTEKAAPKTTSGTDKAGKKAAPKEDPSDSKTAAVTPQKANAKEKEEVSDDLHMDSYGKKAETPTATKMKEKKKLSKDEKSAKKKEEKSARKKEEKSARKKDRKKKKRKSEAASHDDKEAKKKRRKNDEDS